MITEDIEGMAAKDKATLMREGRERREAAGLKRYDSVYIHKSYTRADLEKAIKKLQKPANKA